MGISRERNNEIMKDAKDDSEKENQAQENEIPVLGFLVDFVSGRTNYDPPSDPQEKEIYDKVYYENRD